jgi:hypothetical protein
VEVEEGTSAATEVVRLDFNFGAVIGQPVPAIQNLGDPDIKVSVVSKNGGKILVAGGRPGNGQAINFPDHDGGEFGPRAVLKLVDNDLSDGDALSPGTADFTFGADFKLDAISVSTKYDNGNNLIQRGLHGSSDQYKIQVDKTAAGMKPSCSLAQKISADETRSASVTSNAIIEPGHWYRVRCRREGSTLTIVVTLFNADGTQSVVETPPVTNIPVVDLTWPLKAPVVPMSIGGKLHADGTIVSESDQFNGLVDNPMLKVDN